MSARRRLSLALLLSAAVAAFEFWGGAVARSLALTTDAVHVCVDVLALAIALLASIGATRRANRRKTFGYGRLEVLGALLNCAILLAATGVIAYAAIQRFHAPLEPHGFVMTAVAAIGLTVNTAIGLTLMGHHRHHDHNVRAVLAHVAGDALGALAVIVGGIAIAYTGAAWIDPLLSLFVAAIIVVGVAGVLRDASDVLLEGAPAGVDAVDVELRIRAIDGVVGVHDLHVWTIASGSHALSAHLLLEEGRVMQGPQILRALQTAMRERYGIGHITIQLESEHCDPGGIIICPSDEA
ncbi:MAG TPA: cation diffusion facilitator family transporter [Candidatus Acidoferrales bacterium]|nr:cation diffusion facilitator family transporter [Candidatus Acidoferrales bacterium]